jgi:hypothetical protein
MSVDRKNTIEWDGKELGGWITINGAPTKVSADRDTIHAHAPGFNDALTREINRHRAEIFEKLIPFFQSRAASRDRLLLADACDWRASGNLLP